MRRVMGICAATGMILSGCSVNQAVIDPFGYAPDSPCWYWTSECGSKLSCCDPVAKCPDLPCEEYILSLAEVLDIALINSPVTQKSWALAREAAADYGLSQASFFPTLIASYEYIASRTSFLTTQVEQQQNVQMNGIIISSQQQWGPILDVTWTILDFGQRRYSSMAALYSLYSANFNHNQTIQALVQNVTVDYYNYLYQKKLLEAYEADLATSEETLAAAQSALQSGTKNVSDVLQARTQFLLTEMTLSQQFREVNTAYSTLLATMGLPANITMQLQKLPFVDPDEVDLDPLDEYLEIALQCRPDLLAARSNVISAENALVAARRAWVPVVGYQLTLGNNTYNGGFNDKYNYVSTLSVQMPLFTGFQIRNTIRKNEAILKQEESSLKEMELNVVQEVTNAHYNISVAFDTLKAAIRLLESAKEEYHVTITQYRRGINTILDVLSAQSSLFDARARQAEALQQWFTSLATLTYSIGLMSKNIQGCL